MVHESLRHVGVTIRERPRVHGWCVIKGKVPEHKTSLEEVDDGEHEDSGVISKVCI